ncbi:hypothetical protein B0H17DRAFT_1080039 [Mycena rosella]|uniref:Uncharacterized protein n=1 Tax=Mycena rosella TaxID=1033263 RepID=A0AAD7D6Y0_MYCRO|nr:hypothetical protein B0H17DRAFT_1080039 [Mycena rosella]
MAPTDPLSSSPACSRVLPYVIGAVKNIWRGERGMTEASAPRSRGQRRGRTATMPRRARARDTTDAPTCVHEHREPSAPARLRYDEGATSRAVRRIWAGMVRLCGGGRGCGPDYGARTRRREARKVEQKEEEWAHGEGPCLSARPLPTNPPHAVRHRRRARTRWQKLTNFVGREGRRGSQIRSPLELELRSIFGSRKKVLAK